MAPGPPVHQQQQETSQSESTDTTTSTTSTSTTLTELQLENTSPIPTQEETQVCTRLMAALLECRLKEALAAEAMAEEASSNQAGKIYYREFDNKSDLVTCYDRDRMVQWLCVLTHDFHYCTEVFFRATSILDAFLSVMKVRSRFLQCITATCFFTASKLEEKPQSVQTVVSDIVRNYSCAFSVRDIHRMELILVQKLDFKFSNNTPYDFLKIFHILGITNGSLCLPSGLSHDQHLCHTALCLEEIVSNHTLMKFRPSLLALAVLGCDLKLLGCDWLTAVVTLQNLSEVRGRELSVCYEAVAPLYNIIATRHPLYIGPPSPPSPPTPTEPVKEEEKEKKKEGGEGTLPDPAKETEKEGKQPASEVEPVKEKEGKSNGSSVDAPTPPPPPPPEKKQNGGVPVAKKEGRPKLLAMKFPKSVKTVAV